MKNAKLRAARAKKHWSMEVAAEKIGVSKTSIARWENGEQQPRGTSLDLVCAAYGLSAEELGLVDDDTTNILQTHQDTLVINSKNSLPAVFSQDIADRRSFLPYVVISHLTRKLSNICMCMPFNRQEPIWAAVPGIMTCTRSKRHILTIKENF